MRRSVPIQRRTRLSVCLDQMRIATRQANNTKSQCKLPPTVDSHQENFLAHDVGPVLRRSLTRADDFFDDRLALTLCDKLIRGQVPE